MTPHDRPMPLDARADETLDVLPLLEWFAGHAVCALGRERVLARRPMTAAPASAAPARLSAAQQLVREAWDLYDRREELPLAGLFDATAVLAALAMTGGRLEPGEFLRVARFAALAGPAAHFARAHAGTQPELAAVAGRIVAVPEIEREVRRAIDDAGLVRDDASPELARVRQELRRAEARLASEIARLAREYGAAGVLSDTFHTLRNGRHVLPVAAGRRGAVPGIVHGHSGSGETLFIEPASVVEIANDLADLHGREADEVDRILRHLADVVRPHLPTLEENLDAFAELDDLHARADAGWRAGWALPRLAAPEEALRLDRVHHPLLRLRRPDQSVALTFALGRRERVLVLSGPNAGGKTTTLKVLGLTSWLAQAGFPIPCGVDTVLPVVAHLGVAIGDEQSVAEGESTFSAHVRRLREIVESAGPASLVLLDEIAAGTDPTEGGALAIALLEALAARGARVACTTHLARLTEWADGHEAARNASFRLDPGSGRPTFELAMGVAGTSHALLAAERGGLPRAILERARALIPRERLQAGEMLLTLEAKHRAADEAGRALALERQRIETEAIDLERRLAAFREEKRTFREGVLAAQRRDLARLRAEVERRIAELPPREGLGAAREAIDAASGAVGAAIAEVRAERAAARPSGAGTDDEALEVGARVAVGPLRAHGTILALDREKGLLKLDVAGMRVELTNDQLHAAPLAPEQESLLDTLDEEGDEAGVAEAKGGPGGAGEAAMAGPLAAITRRPGRGLFRHVPTAAAGAPPGGAPTSSRRDAAPRRKKSARNRDWSEDAFLHATQTPPRRAGESATSVTRAAGATDSASPPRRVIDGDAARAAPARAPLPLTLDLHGRRVEEALPMVDDFLDRAILNDWPHVRLMHGIGTGTLGRAIRAHLRDHPLIARAYPATSEDGGAGVTVVEFRN